MSSLDGSADNDTCRVGGGALVGSGRLGVLSSVRTGGPARQGRGAVWQTTGTVRNGRAVVTQRWRRCRAGRAKAHGRHPWLARPLAANGCTRNRLGGRIALPWPKRRRRRGRIGRRRDVPDLAHSRTMAPRLVADDQEAEVRWLAWASPMTVGAGTPRTASRCPRFLQCNRGKSA